MGSSTAIRNIDWEIEAKKIAAGDCLACKRFVFVFADAFAVFFIRNQLSPGEAEDLAVSCVDDIAMQITKYKPLERGSFVAWAFTIARHRLADWKRKCHPQVPLLDDTVAWRNETEIEPDFEKILAVREAIARLSNRDQQIIRLRYFDTQHSFEEIGEHLKIQEGNARVGHHRALRILKNILENDPRIKLRG